MKMDRKYWLNTVIVCFLMMIIIIQIPMHVYADEKGKKQVWFLETGISFCNTFFCSTSFCRMQCGTDEPDKNQ